MTGYGAAFDWVRGHVEAERLPSAVLGIATAEGIVALDAFGSTGPRPARGSDPYRLFSITKVLMGLTAARAVERGLLSPQTPLSTAVPQFGAGREDVVRLEHLVSHTSGIPEPALDSRTPLREALTQPGRDFAAGAASRYSTIAFEGVAALLDAATGATWEAGVAQWADPLGATGITLDEEANPHAIVDGADLGFDADAFTAQRNPGAGLIGTAADLLAVGAALLRDAGEIVQPATLAMMRRSLTGAIPRLEPYPAERGQDWGFTWNLRTRAPGLIDRDVYGHGGWAGTEFWVHPTAGVAYVLLTNIVQRRGVDADGLDNAVVTGV
ncbi:beta-lactamase family protein [Microbacterium sp. Sa4CUA7]|uniref:Beta-lactamase family protein n=1 Tax=Microbacterium pullorum TaxID=2762236 RepID=A0ABR8S2Q3_9MICO|nr:serine hydrolase domain-containing protein [Microbacterium pullorum]MBD7957634.1 beta-lactamase family protein [Microbacterium pullorum]